MEYPYVFDINIKSYKRKYDDTDICLIFNDKVKINNNDKTNKKIKREKIRKRKYNKINI